MRKEDTWPMLANLPLTADHKLILSIMLQNEGVGDWTSREMLEAYREYTKDTKENSSISGRMSELEDYGYVDLVERRECDVSGYVAKARSINLSKIRDWDNVQVDKESNREVVRALEHARLKEEAERRRITMELFGKVGE